MAVKITTYCMAAFFAIQELVWVKGVLSELGIDLVDRTTSMMDAQSAISLAKNPTHHKRSKLQQETWMQTY